MNEDGRSPSPRSRRRSGSDLESGHYCKHVSSRCSEKAPDFRRWTRVHAVLGLFAVTAVILFLLGLEHWSKDFRHSREVIIGKQEKMTIRVNTFRRLDLLEIFLDSHAHCPCVEEIQVVWSDLENPAPLHWTNQPTDPTDPHSRPKYNPRKVKFEIHTTNSLNNRFKPLLNITTTAVLSADDDLSVPCSDLAFALNVWQANPHVLVGFSPRLTTQDSVTGKSRYMRWQHTWWNGKYTIMLTKLALMHKQYMHAYTKLIPPSIQSYIDTHRNCEDIAMAHMVAVHTHGVMPPVWLEAVVFDTGLTSNTGISSQQSHFLSRGDCVDLLLRNYTHETHTSRMRSHSKSQLDYPPQSYLPSILPNGGGTGREGVVEGRHRSVHAVGYPWTVGYQKAVPMGALNGDYFGLTDLLSLH